MPTVVLLSFNARKYELFIKQRVLKFKSADANHHKIFEQISLIKFMTGTKNNVYYTVRYLFCGYSYL